MINFFKRLFCKDSISEKTLKHSSFGDFSNTNRLKGGGHGQESIDYMNKNNIEYNIIKTYKNGVRVGNVPKHYNKLKSTGDKQSWFPNTWNRKDIENAGRSVAFGRKYPDGFKKTGRYKKVKVGIIRTKGKIATIFPLNKQ